ncbi:glycosyltransferase [Saccharopolyspora rectivirgula]|jgi:glycosyltransferase involved in cell wall biosynthesis|uniref:Glycosyl transferase n=1 Tax=Saccharopolyspora rectivirgula TaxID=28042 RepID=A0A073B2M9_9PSEU|nr:glycosyltransferase [Saccharopolyspora rectivirgula]KEI45821.1 glycosyl transferase [Saccharopolyspora rectivirgula]
MRILIWHVHGSWTTAFVQGEHTYLVPVTPGRDADGRGRARTFSWPANAVEVEPDQLRDEHVDVVVLQRPHELELAEKWLGRRPGTDVPAVYVEHDTPRGEAVRTRHPTAHRSDITLVHVTHFNQLYWDSGRAPNTVIEHGIVDPGYRYTGHIPHTGVVINEPVRRSRITGSDLLPQFTAAAPVDLFGMRVSGAGKWLADDRINSYEDLPQQQMHTELAARRVYLHPYRWTSLGLALLEAMHLGMPVVAVAATEAAETIPPGAGVVSTRLTVLVEAISAFIADPERARQAGIEARRAAKERYSLERFLSAWNDLLEEVVR